MRGALGAAPRARAGGVPGNLCIRPPCLPPRHPQYPGLRRPNERYPTVTEPRDVRPLRGGRYAEAGCVVERVTVALLTSVGPQAARAVRGYHMAVREGPCLLGLPSYRESRPAEGVRAEPVRAEVRRVGPRPRPARGWMPA